MNHKACFKNAHMKEKLSYPNVTTLYLKKDRQIQVHPYKEYKGDLIPEKVNIFQYVTLAFKSASLISLVYFHKISNIMSHYFTVQK